MESSRVEARELWLPAIANVVVTVDWLKERCSRVLIVCLIPVYPPHHPWPLFVSCRVHVLWRSLLCPVLCACVVVVTVPSPVAWLLWLVTTSPHVPSLSPRPAF